MKRLFCSVFCLLAVVGCGGVKELPPPDEAPVMTPEETANMEKQMEEMRKMREQQQRRR